MSTDAAAATLAGLALAAALLGQPAGAFRADVAGVVTIEADVSPAEDCAVGLDAELCAATWGGRDTLTPGDDRVGLYKGADSATVTVHTPAPVPGGPWTVRVQPSALRVPNPAARPAAELWLRANDSLPAEARALATLEARGYQNEPSREGLFVEPHLPLPEGSGRSAAELEDYGVCWSVCYFRENALVEGAEQGWQLFPYNVALFTTDTDAYARAVLENATLCAPPADGPEGCSAMMAARAALMAVEAAYEEAAPSVSFGLSVNRTTLAVRDPADRPGPVAARGVEASLARLPGTGSAQAFPEAEAALAMPRRDAMEPAAGTGTRSASDDAPVAEREPAGLPAAPPADQDHFLAWTAGAAAAAAGLALYHRIARHRALEQATRRKVHEAIQAEPGVRVGTLQVRLGLSYKTVAGHVQVLLRLGLVEAMGEGQRRLFVRGGQGPRDRRAAVAASAPASRAVLAYLQAAGPADLPTLRAALGLPKATATVAVNRLAHAGLVRKQRARQRVVVAAIPAPLGPATADPPSAAPPATAAG